MHIWCVDTLSSCRLAPNWAFTSAWPMLVCHVSLRPECACGSQ
jgi:hypothetical protein